MLTLVMVANMITKAKLDYLGDGLFQNILKILKKNPFVSWQKSNLTKKKSYNNYYENICFQNLP